MFNECAAWLGGQPVFRAARSAVERRDTAQAMSQENVEIVRRAFAAYDKGDMSEMLELMADDMTTHRMDPDGATYHGQEGFFKATADWTEDFEDWSASPEKFVDAGGHVLVRVHQTARGATSGVPVETSLLVRLHPACGEDRAAELPRHRSRRPRSCRAVGVAHPSWGAAAVKACPKDRRGYCPGDVAGEHREALGPDRDPAAAGTIGLRADLRLGPGAGPRPLGGPDRYGCILGKGGSFDQAIADFSERYADQNELDYGALADAAKSGRIEVETDLV